MWNEMIIDERVRKEVEQATERIKAEVLAQICDLKADNIRLLADNIRLRNCAKEYQKRLREKHAVMSELCDTNVEMGKTINELKKELQSYKE